MSDSPGYRGSPVNISANRLPIAQMSIALVEREYSRYDDKHD